MLYTAPIFSVVLAKYFLKEKIEKKTLWGLFLAVVGIAFILDPRTFSFSSRETIGNLLGLCSGFSYAMMALIAKPVLKKVSGYYVAFR